MYLFLAIVLLVPVILHILSSTRRQRLFTQADQYQPTKKGIWAGKHVLVVVNPVGGNRTGVETCERIVKPVLAKAGVLVTVVQTQSAADPEKIGRELDVAKYSGLISVSGDGMLNQIFRGFANRVQSAPPAERARLWAAVAFGIIPCGTGNGFAGSFAAPDPFTAARLIAEAQQTAALDVVEMRHRAQDGVVKPLWDIHMTSFGGIADLDLIVEVKIRWMPRRLRELVAPAMAILQAREFKVRLSLLPAPVPEAQLRPKGQYRDCSALPEDPERPGWHLYEGPVGILSFMNVSHASTDVIFSPACAASAGTLDVFMLKDANKFNLLRMFLASGDGSCAMLDYVHVFKVQKYHLSPDPSTGGHFSVSGEITPGGELSATVHSGLSRCMFPPVC